MCNQSKQVLATKCFAKVSCSLRMSCAINLSKSLLRNVLQKFLVLRDALEGDPRENMCV